MYKYISIDFSLLCYVILLAVILSLKRKKKDGIDEIEKRFSDNLEAKKNGGSRCRAYNVFG